MTAHPVHLEAYQVRDIVSSSLFERNEVGTLGDLVLTGERVFARGALGLAGRAARLARATAGAAVARFPRVAG